MTIAEYKDKVRKKKLSDIGLLVKAGVSDLMVDILKFFKEYADKYNDPQGGDAFESRIYDIDNDDKDSFFGYFDNILPTSLWDDKPVLKQILAVIFKSQKENFPNINLLKEGELKGTEPVDVPIPYSPLTGLKALYRLFDNANPERTVFEKSSINSKNFVNNESVFVDMMDGYLASPKPNSYTHIVYGVEEFDDANFLYKNNQKYVDVDSTVSSNVRADGKKVEPVKQIISDNLSHFKNDSYWTTTVEYNLKPLLDGIKEGVDYYASFERDADAPLFLTIGDHTFAYDIMDVYRSFYLMTSLHNEATDNITVKINDTTGELLIVCGTLQKTIKGTEEQSFSILTPINLEDALLSYMVFGKSASTQSSGSIREMAAAEAASKKKLLELVSGTVIESDPLLQAAQEMSKEDFYATFIAQCEEYVLSYTNKEQCEGKTDICYIPKDKDDYLKRPDGTFLTNRKGEKIVDTSKIYSIRDCFWINNEDISIVELIAFFVAKGKTKKYNSLSKEILGYSCAEYTEYLVDELIKDGYLCIEDIKLTGNTADIKYTFAADYCNGNYYDKMQLLVGEITSDVSHDADTYFTNNIKSYFGKEAGDEIIRRQIDALNSAKPTRLIINVDEEDPNEVKSKLQISPDSFFLWRKFPASGGFIEDAAPVSGNNVRMGLCGNNRVFREFYEWMRDAGKDYDLMNEFKGSYEELFDACVTPDSDMNYILNYILPNWTINDEHGEPVSHPIKLPQYQSWTFKKDKWVPGELVQIDFSLTSAFGFNRMWDGDGHYAKDKGAKIKGRKYEYGEEVTYYEVKADKTELDTGLKYFLYYNTPDVTGKKLIPASVNKNMTPEQEAACTQARLDWERTCRDIKTASISALNARKSSATQVCYTMFNLWLSKMASEEIRTDVEFAWNKEYNSIMLPNWRKFPMFVEHTRYFGKNFTETFRLAPSQKEGVKTAISRGNNLIVGHEVGWGKSLVFIMFCSHLFNTGEASRILLTVESNVYDKWRREIEGDENFRGANKNFNVVMLGNAREDIFVGKGAGNKNALKEYTEIEEQAIQAYRKTFIGNKSPFDNFMASHGFQLDIFDNTIVQGITDLLASAIPSWENKSLYQEFFTGFIDEISGMYNYYSQKTQNEYNSLDRSEKAVVDRLEEKKKALDKKGNPLTKPEIKRLDDLIQTKKDRTVKAKDKIRKDHSIGFSKSVILNVKKNSVWARDEFGTYLPAVMKENTIILCTHGALNVLRADPLSCAESLAIMQDSLEDFKAEGHDVAPGEGRGDRMQYITKFRHNRSVGTQSQKDNDRTDIFSDAISVERLNIDCFGVDEVGNFNNIISTIRKRGVEVGEKDKKGRPMNYETKAVRIRSGSARGRISLQYYTSSHGSVKLQSLNTLAIARHVQNKNRAAGKGVNTMLLSATPFTDDAVYQMMSVFSILNYEQMLKCGISGVFDLINNYAIEVWDTDITYNSRIDIFPGVSQYRNVLANSNFLHLFVNFKIRDAEIEKRRPKKFTLPDLNMRMFVNILKDCKDVNAYVEFNDYQKKCKELTLEVLHGEKTIEDVFGKLDTETMAEAEQEQKEQDGITVEVMKINFLEDVYKLKDIAPGQIIKIMNPGTSNPHKFIELIGEDPSLVESWSEQRDTVDAEVEEEEEGAEAEAEEAEKGETINRKSGNLGVAITKGGLNKETKQKAVAMQIMGADANISLSPYIADIKGINLPPLLSSAGKLLPNAPKIFVENSPKLLYTAKCIKTVLDYHKANGTTPSSQLVYLNRQMFKYGTQRMAPLELFKQYLIDENILPADKIAIVTGSTKDEARDVIRDKFNKGEIQVLIGTSAIKQGMDLHLNTSVIYILQADYLPSTLMQVEGRGWRQGNKFKNIRIVYVMSYGSLDGFQFAKVNQKIRQIKRMLESTVFDMNTTQYNLDYNEMKLELETNLPRRAELIFAVEKNSMNGLKTRYTNELEVYKDLSQYIGTYLPKWEKFINNLNVIGEACVREGFEAARAEYIKGPAMRVLRAKQKEARNAKLDAERKRIADANAIAQAKIDEGIGVEEKRIEDYNAVAQPEIDAAVAIENASIELYDKMIENKVDEAVERIKKLTPELLWAELTPEERTAFLTANTFDVINATLDFTALPDAIKAKLDDKALVKEKANTVAKAIKQGDPAKTWEMLSEKDRKTFLIANKIEATTDTPYDLLPTEAKEKLIGKDVFEDIVKDTIKTIKLGNPAKKWEALSVENKTNFANSFEPKLTVDIIPLSYDALPTEVKAKLVDKNAFKDIVGDTISAIKLAGKPTLINKGQEDEIISAMREKIVAEDTLEQQNILASDEDVKKFINHEFDLTITEETPNYNTASDMWADMDYTERKEFWNTVTPKMSLKESEDWRAKYGSFDKMIGKNLDFFELPDPLRKALQAKFNGGSSQLAQGTLDFDSNKAEKAWNERVPIQRRQLMAQLKTDLPYDDATLDARSILRFDQLPEIDRQVLENKYGGGAVNPGTRDMLDGNSTTATPGEKLWNDLAAASRDALLTRLKIPPVTQVSNTMVKRSDMKFTQLGTDIQDAIEKEASEQNSPQAVWDSWNDGEKVNFLTKNNLATSLAGFKYKTLPSRTQDLIASILRKQESSALKTEGEKYWGKLSEDDKREFFRYHAAQGDSFVVNYDLLPQSVKSALATSAAEEKGVEEAPVSLVDATQNLGAEVWDEWTPPARLEFIKGLGDSNDYDEFLQFKSHKDLPVTGSIAWTLRDVDRDIFKAWDNMPQQERFDFLKKYGYPIGLATDLSKKFFFEINPPYKTPTTGSDKAIGLVKELIDYFKPQGAVSGSNQKTQSAPSTVTKTRQVIFSVPKQCDYKPVFVYSPLSEIKGACDNVRDFADKLMGKGYYENAGEEKQAQLQVIMEALVSCGYEKGKDKSELFYDIFPTQVLSDDNRLFDNAWDAFLMEMTSFGVNTSKTEVKPLKATIIKNFYEKLNGNVDNLKIKNKEAKANLDEVNKKTGNKEKRVKEILKTLEEKNKKKAARGAYDLDAQVALFAKTNALIQVRNDEN